MTKQAKDADGKYLIIDEESITVGNKEGESTYTKENPTDVFDIKLKKITIGTYEILVDQFFKKTKDKMAFKEELNRIQAIVKA